MLSLLDAFSPLSLFFDCLSSLAIVLDEIRILSSILCSRSVLRACHQHWRSRLSALVLFSRYNDDAGDEAEQ